MSEKQKIDPKMLSELAAGSAEYVIEHHAQAAAQQEPAQIIDITDRLARSDAHIDGYFDPKEFEVLNMVNRNAERATARARRERMLQKKRSQEGPKALQVGANLLLGAVSIYRQERQRRNSRLSKTN